MDAEHKDRIDAVLITLRTLLLEDEHWQADLEASLKKVEITPERRQEVKGRATDSLKSMFNASAIEKLNTRDALLYAFTSPIKTLFFPFISWDEKPLADLHHILTDIEYNYRTVLGDHIPPSIAKILDLYKEELLPEIEDLIVEISGEDNYLALRRQMTTSETFEGYDHITAMLGWT